MTKQLLLNELDRRLLTAQGTLLQQAQDRISRIAEHAKGEWEAAIAAVVTSKPMRERPPVKAKIAYDEAQGALVWEIDPPPPALPPYSSGATPPAIEDVDPPTTETSDTADTAEPVTADTVRT